MYNLALFLASCGLVATAAWFFCYLGQSALTAWIAILSLLANLFVLKQIDFMGWNATASEIFAIGSLFGLNLLQEKFGKKATQRAIWASFGCFLFFVIMAQIHLAYQPSIYDNAHEAYQFLLTPTPRIMIASLTTFLIVQQFDSRFYGFCRRYFPSLPYLWISGIVMGLSQLLDTLLFSFLGLYGIVGAIVEIMIVSYAIKLMAIASTVPWAYLTSRIFVKNDISQSH